VGDGRQDGCDFNPYRLGDTTFFGNGSANKVPSLPIGLGSAYPLRISQGCPHTTALQVDSTKVFTVVTQFITSDGTATGDLIEIRRKYDRHAHVAVSRVGTLDSLAAACGIRCLWHVGI
jgi:cellulose 1,4-beta-cellobiosidase